MKVKNITIFTGHFGSGKTEVAVNFIVKMLGSLKKRALIDIDVVNPYFRAYQAKKSLENENIKVISPIFTNTNIDVPSLSPQVTSIIQDNSYEKVIDVGGDDLGSKVLSTYKDKIEHHEYDMFCVVNTKRLYTNSFEKIARTVFEIESSSRLKITGLINNTNLLNETNSEDIIEGMAILEKASKELAIPIVFTTVMANKFDLKNVLNIDIMEMEQKIKMDLSANSNL